MSEPSGVDRKRQRMERALAALAGSGLDSARFTVAAEPMEGPGSVDRSMTVVFAVRSGELSTLLEDVALEDLVAWVCDPWADPDLALASDGALMCDWRVGTVAELRAALPLPDEESAGWLVVSAEAPTEASDAVLLAAVEAALEGGASPSRAAKAVGADFGVPKRRVYDLMLSLGDGH